MAWNWIKQIFGNNASRQDIPIQQDLANPNRASYENGIPQICSQNKSAGGQPPMRADFNELFSILMNNFLEIQSGNYPTFDIKMTQSPNTGYAKGAVLWFSNATTGEAFPVISLRDNNTQTFIDNGGYYIGDNDYWRKVSTRRMYTTDNGTVLIVDSGLNTITALGYINVEVNASPITPSYGTLPAGVMPSSLGIIHTSVGMCYQSSPYFSRDVNAGDTPYIGFNNYSGGSSIVIGCKGNVGGFRALSYTVIHKSYKLL